MDSEECLARESLWMRFGVPWLSFTASMVRVLTGLSLIDYDVEKKMAVIRVALAAVDLVRASLASITFLAGREAAVHVLAVSGTIKALREKFR